MSELDKKFKVYYLTAVFSMLFAVIGFSYNAWRLEISEDNNNIRTAAFEVLTELANLQELIYSAHYDQDVVAGSPRKGWVKIGLIVDLSVLIGEPVTVKSLRLKHNWTDNWDKVPDSRESTDEIINDMDEVRMAIMLILKDLE